MFRTPSFAVITVVIVLSAACSSQPPTAPSFAGPARVDTLSAIDSGPVTRTGLSDARALLGPCTVTVTSAAATPDTLWSPNHKWNNIAVSYTPTASCGTPPAPVVPTCSLSVSSNEPVNGLGDGNTSPDWQVIDATHVRLRAERSGTGTGRIYTITVTCTAGDPLVSASTATAVTVAHDQRKS
jgi:hypothetical protein